MSSSRTCLGRRRRCWHGLQEVEGAAPSWIQCTPDLQPTDVTGLSIFDQKSRTSNSARGRSSQTSFSWTRSTARRRRRSRLLLEAMAEQQVTVDGATRELPSPFLLLATENSIEYEDLPAPRGAARPLLLRTALGYPEVDDEPRILDQRYQHPLEQLGPVVSVAEINTSASCRAARLRRRRPPALGRRPRASDPSERGGRDRELRSRQPRPRASRSRMGARRLDLRRPRGRNGSSSMVLAHRVVYTPSFVARARATGWSEAIEEFRLRRPEIAPRPARGGSALRGPTTRLKAVANLCLTFPLVPRRGVIGISGPCACAGDPAPM